MIESATYIAMPTMPIRDVARDMVMAHLPKPEIKAAATSEYDEELIDKALANPNTPPDEREYLLRLLKQC